MVESLEGGVQGWVGGVGEGDRCFSSAMVGTGVVWLGGGVTDFCLAGGLVVVGDVAFGRAASRAARSTESMGWSIESFVVCCCGWRWCPYCWRGRCKCGCRYRFNLPLL